MIFVAVGNAKQGFPRLVRGVDALVGAGVFGECQVFLQIGSDTAFVPQFCEWSGFLPPEEFERMLKDAEVVVTHAGFGTLLQALRTGKTPVVMPRRKKYGEVVNDHQLQVLEALESAGLVIAAHETEGLPEAIAEARTRQSMVVLREPSAIIALVGAAIDELGQRSQLKHRCTS